MHYFKDYNSKLQMTMFSKNLEDKQAAVTSIETRSGSKLALKVCKDATLCFLKLLGTLLHS